MTQRLPIERKALSGTLRPNREIAGIDAGARLRESPPPPPRLSEAAAVEWVELAPLLVDLGILSTADLRTLALLCETLATVTELETAIRKHGFLIPCATGGEKAHPALKALETQRSQAARLMDGFGLSPKSRKYVEKAPGPRKGSIWQKYLPKDHPDYDEYDHLPNIDD